MSRRGFALPLAVLLLLALTGLAHGTLLMARNEEATSRLAARLLARELAVRGALLSAAHRGDTLPLLPVGGEVGLPGRARPGVPPVVVRIARLDRELHLLLAHPPGGGGGAGLVLWALDPLARVTGVQPWGAATAAPGASVDRADPRVPDPCAHVRALLEGPGGPPGAGSLPPGLGLLAADTVLARTPLRVSGVVTPRPGSDPWTCPTATLLNWGAPSDPAHPCAGHRPFVGSDGDVVLDGGEGQGVLAVRGDLTVRGSRYEGLLLAGGRVRLREGAVVRGRIAAAGGIDVGPGSALLDDACAAYLSLGAAAALRLPVILPAGAWIRPL